MILTSLFKKIKFLVVLVIIIVVLFFLIKIFKLKPAVEKMIRDEVNLLKMKSDESSSDQKEPVESKSWEDRLGSFLFPKSEVKPEKTKSVQEEDSEEGKRRAKKKKTRDAQRRSGSKTSTYKREELCRKIFEDYFDDYFPTCRPNFLANPETGRNLELDGFNAALNLAFEGSGKQHYTYPNAFHKTREEFDKQVKRDIYKRQRLSELGIDLIEINFTEVSIENTEAYIHSALKQLGH